MELDIDPILEIYPFENQYAVRAEVLVGEQSKEKFAKKTFLMFVLEIRSAMEENEIKNLKSFIIDSCEDLLQNGGITNIGFIINENYYTIRNPNVEGIKDLLNAHAKVGDTKDLTMTIRSIRNAITSEFAKTKDSKLSIVWFTSNVTENTLNPVKQNYRLLLNLHIENYERELNRLKRTIQEFCTSCDFYAIGYVKSFNNTKNKGYLSSFGNVQVDQSLDIALFYKINEISTRESFSFNICESFICLNEKFKEISALLSYEFHEISLMVPIRKCLQLSESKYTVDNENENIEHEDKKEIKEKELKEKEIKEKEEINEMNMNEMQNEIEIEIDDEMKQILKERESEFEEMVEEEEEIEYVREKQYYTKFNLFNFNVKQAMKFTTSGFRYFSKTDLDLKELHDHGYHVFSKANEVEVQKFPIKRKLLLRKMFTFVPEFTSTNVNFSEPDSLLLIELETGFYVEKLREIIIEIQNSILSIKKRFIGTCKGVKIFENYLEVDEDKQNELRRQVFKIDEKLKAIFKRIFEDETIKTQKAKNKMYELYKEAKVMIDETKEVFIDIFKKEIKNEDFNKLSASINYNQIKSSLKKKLIKRINCNPNMLNEVYEKVENICEEINFVDIEAEFKIEKSEVGNCMYTFKNFAGALKNRDCLGVMFEMERPDSAIADPGRIRIREVSPLVCTVSKFFQTHLYLHLTTREEMIQYAISKNTYIDEKFDEDFYCPICGDECIYQSRFWDFYTEEQKETMKNEEELNKQRKSTTFGLSLDYMESWDYWNRVDSKHTYFGIMPLYICEKNWQVAKQIMKPCMGWNSCGEPMGYTYNQMQTIPFMVQSSFIRAIQETEYKIQDVSEKIDKMEKHTKKYYDMAHERNNLKQKKSKLEALLKHVEMTCSAIMRDTSTNVEEPLDALTIERYTNYKDPLKRTVDVISNNSCFLSQIYTVISNKKMEKPKEEEFNFFFIRLLEEELRRETDGWNEEEVEEKFINKLLNAKIEAMDKPKYVALISEYADKFNEAKKGNQVYRTEFEIQRENLEMMIKENNKFNDTQRLTIIEYKRLYENRVLWLWYIHFKLYGEKERILIHKWKALNLTNSYQLFTMIIQNKKQRKNYKRREAIMSGYYVDPFDYYAARQFLENEFIKIRNKKESQNIVMLNQEKYGNAATVFAKSRDLCEAAGAILNIQIGKEISIFFQELLNQSQFVEEKLRILLYGKYQGVQLFKYGWKMSKKNMLKIEKKYPKEFEKYKYMF